MRILVVTTWYPDPDAPETTPFVPRHVSAIGRDHEVHVVHVRLLNSSPATQESWGGVPVTRVGLDPRHPLSVVRALREIRRWARYSDVVHTMAFSSALVAAPAVVGRPWVHTEHWNGVLHPDVVNRWWERAAGLRHVLRLPTLVTGVSTLVNETLERFARPGRVRPLGNVVDVEGEVAPARPSARTVSLVGVGSLIDRKGPDVAVETVAWLREQGILATLTWDGTGPMLQSCLERAEALGISEFVTFNGFRGPEEVWGDLRAADVFVLPTASETFCVAAAEALAAGRPVVMGDRGGQRDFVTPTTGRLVSTRSAQAYGRAVVEVLQDTGIDSPEELARGIRARYGAASVAEQLTALYEEARALAGARHR